MLHEWPLGRRRRLPVVIWTLVAIGCHGPSIVLGQSEQPKMLELSARTRDRLVQSGSAPVRAKRLSWDPRRTALLICDMWDVHHCRGATRRVAELAPRIQHLSHHLRGEGVLIVHAPSSTMRFYEGHPARVRALKAPRAADLPADMSRGCDRIPAEEGSQYPIDQSDGGCDCQPKCPHGAPWRRQHAEIEILEQDVVSDSGEEIWNVFREHGIEHVIFCGVHTNMCVMARPFGLRNLSSHGLDVVLVRDLTDTMYNSDAWPYVNHFTGTDLIVEHIEKTICPTVTSDQCLGSLDRPLSRTPFRFSEDQRLRLVMLIADREYRSHETLTSFAIDRLRGHFSTEYVLWDAHESHTLTGLEALPQADAMLISAWRRTPPIEQLRVVREFVAAGKPVVGIRTSSHAFARRDDGITLPDGHDEWPTFDQEVFGCHYKGHHGNHPPDGPKSFVWAPTESRSHMVLQGVSGHEHVVPSWLYKVSPLNSRATVLLMGRVEGRQPPEPVAWTYIRSDGGRSVYTSLGHPDEFNMPEFRQLLVNGIFWGVERDVPHDLQGEPRR